MLGNPPVPHYGMELSDDATEVENYEVCSVHSQGHLKVTSRAKCGSAEGHLRTPEGQSLTAEGYLKVTFRSSRGDLKVF